MFDKFKSNSLQYFIGKASLLYTLCYLVYEFIIKRYTSLDQLFIRLILNCCRGILDLLGFQTFASRDINEFQVFGVDGSQGVWIGGPCNGVTLMFLFAIFIIAYPGNRKAKLWYLPAGIAAVYLINVLRIVCLALIAYYSPQSLQFNHTYTFTFIAYSFVFGLWMLWVNKFSNS
jgi:exosortase family protein XrtF